MLRNVVERQRTPPEVQIHSDPAAGGGGDAGALLVVLEGTGRVRAVQAPRLGVMSELAVAPSSAPAHAFVANADGHASGAAPLHLPVAASGHAGSAQNLGPAAEAGRVVRVRLRLRACGHLASAVGEAQIWVGRVWVQGNVVGVWNSSRLTQ